MLVMSEGMAISGHVFKQHFYIARKPGKSKKYPYSLFHLKTGIKIASFAHTFFEVTECVREITKCCNWDFSLASDGEDSLAQAGEILKRYDIEIREK
jgi:hypothetical protein